MPARHLARFDGARNAIQWWACSGRVRQLQCYRQGRLVRAGFITAGAAQGLEPGAWELPAEACQGVRRARCAYGW